jgi:hypothetical protein
MLHMLQSVVDRFVGVCDRLVGHDHQPERRGPLVIMLMKLSFVFAFEKFTRNGLIFVAFDLAFDTRLAQSWLLPTCLDFGNRRIPSNAASEKY